MTLPVGVSFFTFMAISYVVDTYRGELVPTTLMRFAVFQAFFPHLVAGPIVRAGELLPQLEQPRDPRRVDTGRAFFLIVTGLFLKVVIANHLATHIVDDVFAAPNRHSSLEVLVAVYGYAVQIFADFCGYTNIAIGVALLLGFEFPQNFASPYTAVSLQDFWRRWHMTLSRFLRDYLYIPLGGNRKGRIFTYRNLLLTMLLGGLWHGAAWTFVVWGGIHGLGLAVERATGWRPHTRAQVWFGRVAHVPRRLLRVDLLPRRLVLARRRRDRAALRRVGSELAARHDLGRARDRSSASSGSTSARPRSTSLVASFQRLPIVAQSACVGGRAHPDQHARPDGRRALHLLPLLMICRLSTESSSSRSRSSSRRCSRPKGCASRRRSSRRVSSATSRCASRSRSSRSRARSI